MTYIPNPDVKLLPWPRLDWLLEAGSKVQPDLSIAARQMLLVAARNWQDADGATWGQWFPVHTAYHDTADELHLAGYLQKHPDARKRTWYGITDAGLAQARSLEDAARSDRQRGLERRRSWRFAEIQQELAQAGYYRLPEPGRRWETGEVAFFRPADGQRCLLTCRLGTINWTQYDRQYYKPVTDSAPRVNVRMDARPISQIAAEIPF